MDNDKNINIEKKSRRNDNRIIRSIDEILSNSEKQPIDFGRSEVLIKIGIYSSALLSNITLPQIIEANPRQDKEYFFVLLSIFLLTGILSNPLSTVNSIKKRKKFRLYGNLGTIPTDIDLKRNGGFKLYGNGKMPTDIVLKENSGFKFYGNGNIPTDIDPKNDGGFRLYGNGKIPKNIYLKKNGGLKLYGNGKMPTDIVIKPNNSIQLYGNGLIPTEIVLKENGIIKLNGNGRIPTDIDPV